MYIADVLAVEHLDTKVKDCLVSSLLNIGYLPELIRSLVIFSTKGKST